MKANYERERPLQTAIMQLQRVAQKERTQAQRDSRYKTVLTQEAKQLDEALRLLRWISK
jgi:hypothetical protein